MFIVPMKVGSPRSTAAAATTIRQLVTPQLTCHAATVQNRIATTHGRNNGTASDRLRMVKLRIRLRRLTPTAAQVSPLKSPSLGVR